MTSKKHPTDDALDADVRDALLDAVAPLAPSASLRAQVLARARQTKSGADYITVRGDAGSWRELVPGISFKLLTYDTPAGIKSFLLRAAPGARLPSHGHGEFEECLVLEGEFTLGDLRLRAGDFHAATRGTPHGEAYSERGVTIYLRAGVDDYPGVAP